MVQLLPAAQGQKREIESIGELEWARNSANDRRNGVEWGLWNMTCRLLELFNDALRLKRVKTFRDIWVLVQILRVRWRVRLQWDFFLDKKWWRHWDIACSEATHNVEGNKVTGNLVCTAFLTRMLPSITGVTLATELPISITRALGSSELYAAHSGDLIKEKSGTCRSSNATSAALTLLLEGFHVCSTTASGTSLGSMSSCSL